MHISFSGYSTLPAANNCRTVANKTTQPLSQQLQFGISAENQLRESTKAALEALDIPRNQATSGKMLDEAARTILFHSKKVIRWQGSDILVARNLGGLEDLPPIRQGGLPYQWNALSEPSCFLVRPGESGMEIRTHQPIILVIPYPSAPSKELILVLADAENAKKSSHKIIYLYDRGNDFLSPVVKFETATGKVTDLDAAYSHPFLAKTVTDVIHIDTSHGEIGSKVPGSKMIQHVPPEGSIGLQVSGGDELVNKKRKQRVQITIRS